MLFHLHLPEPVFAGLDLRYDAPLHRLSYRPEPLDDLLTWHGLTPGDLAGFTRRDMVDVLLLWYARSRTHGGASNAPLDALLLAPDREITLVCRPREQRRWWTPAPLRSKAVWPSLTAAQG